MRFDLKFSKFHLAFKMNLNTFIYSKAINCIQYFFEGINFEFWMDQTKILMGQSGKYQAGIGMRHLKIVTIRH